MCDHTESLDVADVAASLMAVATLAAVAFAIAASLAVAAVAVS